MMKFLRNAPIRRKLISVILMTSGAVLLLTTAVFITYEFLTFRQTTVQHFSTLGEMIASNSTAALAFQNQADATEVLGALEAEPYLVAACLFDINGEPFARYPKDGPVEALPQALESDGFLFRGAYLIGFQPVMQGHKRMGTLFLKSDMGAMFGRFRLYGVIVLLVAGASVALAYVLSRILEKQVSGPILALAETARAISEPGDHSVRAVRYGNDELGLLTDSFNQMLDRIQIQNMALGENEERLRELNATLEERVHERTTELEAVNKELEAFSYSVSHDLRAPLRHVGGYASLLRQQGYSDLNPTCQRYLTIITDSAKRMGALIDDLLVFSRMGRSDVNKRPVQMADLVAEVVRDVSSEADGREVAWKIDALPEAHVDRDLFKQVWINLLSNALKYTSKRQKAEIEIGCHQNGDGESIFSVRDNGAGFDMSYVNKLFGVFQRLHRTDEFEGTGIGLANVKRIVTRHGGRTWAEGKVDEGAVFFFSLPAMNTAREARKPEAKAA